LDTESGYLCCGGFAPNIKISFVWGVFMILSFHPLFKADRNIICAGRKPAAEELNAIQAAEAVILPQGCSQLLYEWARQLCPHVFPNYNARFKYPGKIGQIQLFQETHVRHPESRTYLSVEAFNDEFESIVKQPPFSFPFVFKFNWGGEGENVHLIHTASQLEDVMKKAAIFERSGQNGFIIQEYISNQNRTLRIVVVGQKRISYWRVQGNSQTFHASLSKGAVIDADSEPDLQQRAVSVLNHFCTKTKINLAGFDFLFSSASEKKEIHFLEINYYFGRRGLGGSEQYYRLLCAEIRNWLDRRGLTLNS
jgi:ribosomal protein S6--L-glutamate ligase